MSWGMSGSGTGKGREDAGLGLEGTGEPRQAVGSIRLSKLSISGSDDYRQSHTPKGYSSCPKEPFPWNGL